MWERRTGAGRNVTLARSLGDASAGIVCLTPENLTENWILFEAGALSREPSDRVWTFLLDVEDAQLPSPLGQFQNTKATRPEVLLLIQSMNRVIVAKELRNDADLTHMFDKLWPDLEARIAEIRAMPREREPARRPDHDILGEVLATVRDIGKQSSIDSWRVTKTLAMLNQIYRQVLGTRAPSLKELAEMQEREASMEGLQAALSENMKISDGNPMSLWQPQYGNTPLPLRTAAAQQSTVVEPIMPPAEPERTE